LALAREERYRLLGRPTSRSFLPVPLALYIVICPSRVRTFMEDHEFLVAPVCQVVPFEVKQRYVTDINGIEMETYIDWMKSCYYVTVTGLPAISVPCGFTPEGLSVGIQIVGRHRDDLGVLQLAHAFELATGFGKQRPPISV